SHFNTPSPPDSSTLSLHDALPILDSISPKGPAIERSPRDRAQDRGTRRGCVRARLPDERAARRAGAEAGQGDGRPPHRLGLAGRSEEHTSELQSRFDLVCRLLLEK